MYLTKRQVRRAKLSLVQNETSRRDKMTPILHINGVAHVLRVLDSRCAAVISDNYIAKADVAQTHHERVVLERVAKHYPEYLRLFPRTKFLIFRGWTAAIQERLTFISRKDATTRYGEEHVEKELGFAKMAIEDLGLTDVHIDSDGYMWNTSFASDGRIYIYDFGL